MTENKQTEKKITTRTELTIGASIVDLYKNRSIERANMFQNEDNIKLVSDFIFGLSEENPLENITSTFDKKLKILENETNLLAKQNLSKQKKTKINK